MELIEPGYGLLGWSIFAACLLFVWVWAMISIAKSDFIDPGTKLIWGLVVFFLPFIGTLLYYAIGRNQRINNH